MAEFKNSLKPLMMILENPSAKKGYEELKKYYLSIKKIREAEAIEHLIQTRYAHNTNSDQEQPIDNS